MSLRSGPRPRNAAFAGGTGRAANLSVPTFGKTGTTSDYRDALFVGFAGDLVVGVWIGNDDNSPLPGTAGGGAPARIWRAFMTEALGARPAAAEPVPLSEADRGDANAIAPANGVEAPPIPADTPPVPEPTAPTNAVTLPAPPRIEPAPEN